MAVGEEVASGVVLFTSPSPSLEFRCRLATTARQYSHATPVNTIPAPTIALILLYVTRICPRACKLSKNRAFSPRNDKRDFPFVPHSSIALPRGDPMKTSHADFKLSQYIIFDRNWRNWALIQGEMFFERRRSN